MKKIISALLAAAMIACPLVSASAVGTDIANVNKSFHAGGISPVSSKPSPSPSAASNDEDSDLPASYSSVELGYVTPPKDQGAWNTCAFFSGLGAMESFLLKNGYGEYDLSEEYLNYWAATRSDGNGWLRDYRNDGIPIVAIPSALAYCGVITESELPYMSGGKSSFEELDTYSPLFYADSVRMISDKNQSEIKSEVMKCGAVATSFSMHNDYFNRENNSYCCNEELSVDKANSGGHGIIIVGWDDGYSKFNFLESSRPKEDGAWLVKNSWGEGFNNADYMWISYEDFYLAGDYFGGAYAIEGVLKNHTCNSLLNIDQFGATYNMSLESPNIDNPSDIVFINVFDFTSAMPVISNVEFQTDRVGSEYEIYYIPVSDGVPINDRDKWTMIASGQIEYNGIHDAAVDNFKVPEMTGAIGIRISSPDGNASFGCCEWLSNLSEQYVFLPRTANDRSFFASGNSEYGGINSLSEYYASLDDNIGGNFSINLVTNVMLGDADKNGEITLADAVMIQKNVIGALTLDPDVKEYVADMDGDGEITLADALNVQKLGIGL